MIAESFDYLVRLVIRCAIFERLYIQGYPDLETANLLTRSLLDLYVSTLEYLCYALASEAQHRK